MRKKLLLKSESIAVLSSVRLRHVLGGVTGPPCDVETKQATKCDFGCATGGVPCLS